MKRFVLTTTIMLAFSVQGRAEAPPRYTVCSVSNVTASKSCVFESVDQCQNYLNGIGGQCVSRTKSGLFWR